jgi:hypothetical protein
VRIPRPAALPSIASDWPRAGDTPQWLPVIKSPDSTRKVASRVPTAPPPSEESASDRAPTLKASGALSRAMRAPASGTRRIDPEAGRYSIVAFNRKRRAE